MGGILYISNNNSIIRIDKTSVLLATLINVQRCKKVKGGAKTLSYTFKMQILSFLMSSPHIFTILFLRKSFWTTTINTFFIFYSPFLTFCH